ncbi:hypothetical protein B7H23_07705 [Notoacmeibacter marinus]|uniref:GIY-YIG domain-containing protein n=1 Tax=Notoacmeibacter marinus TaxID=1876515 RepID=A0A231V496_9HYPH|nr:hypothetical protein B7H23_07705 [Notoacmeibacter marinus]
MRILFAQMYNLSEHEIKLVRGVVGIYFIFLATPGITYPFASSRLIYIGMSGSNQNSIAMRLRGHLTGQSGNLGVMNYANTHNLKFTYYSADVLRSYGPENIYDMERFFLSNFLSHHGSYPICNGQGGREIADVSNGISAEVDWDFFS